MTIIDKLTIIKNSVQNIKTALSNKGVSYGDITTLATAIENIQGNNNLPEGYIELSYLMKQSSGSEFFDLNYKANLNTKIVLDFEITSWASNSTQGLFGYFGGSSPLSFCINLWNWSTAGSNKVSSAAALSKSNSGVIEYLTIELNKRYIYTLDTNKYTVNDIIIATYSEQQDISSEENLYLFKINSTDPTYTSAKAATSGKVYSLKIYESDVLVRDFVPVQRKDSLEYGLYDKINGFYLSPSSATAFTGGV